MELLLSELLGKGTGGFSDGPLTKRVVQGMVEDLKDPEFNNQETNTSNQETITTTANK